MTVELTEAQKHQRRLQARNAITEALRSTHHEWHHLNDGDFKLMGDIAMDALADTAAEILTDGTMLRSLNIENGVATLELEPAREILLTLVASMRTMLDSHGAENYLETEITAPSIALDLADGQNPRDAYTVTIQRRSRPTPHQFRQQAEARVTALETELGALQSVVRRAGSGVETPQGEHPDAFPWLKHLDPWDRAQLLADLSEASTALSTPDGINELNRVVHEWKTTAEVLANPELRAALTDKDVPGGAQ